MRPLRGAADTVRREGGAHVFESFLGVIRTCRSSASSLPESARAISSKCDKLSWLGWLVRQVERNEPDDLDDFEPVKSGGEPGLGSRSALIVVVVVMEVVFTRVVIVLLSLAQGRKEWTQGRGVAIVDGIWLCFIKAQ